MKKKHLVITILAIVIVITIVAYFLVKPDTQFQRGRAINELVELLPEKDKDLGRLIHSNYQEYRQNTVRWSFVYNGCILGAAILSALSGILIKFEFFLKNKEFRKDLGLIVAVSATLLITLSSVGDFQDKWSANRKAASEMENLAYDLLKKEPSIKRDLIISKIQSINTTRNKGILGFKKE